MMRVTGLGGKAPSGVTQCGAPWRLSAQLTHLIYIRDGIPLLSCVFKVFNIV